MTRSARDYYDAFSQRQLRDYTDGNHRVDHQLDLLRAGIPTGARNVLVVGCGVGEIVHFLITRIARRAQIVGIDLSKRAIEMAGALFAHERIKFLNADILEYDPGQVRYDVIVLPDVYEHIPIGDRPALHRRLSALLTGDGRILVTIPSPDHQRQVQVHGGDRQIVDEIVTLEDLNQLAADLESQLTYFAIISVWTENDYAHAVIDREPVAMGSRSQRIRPAVQLEGRSGTRRLLYQAWRRFLVRPFRRWRVRRCLDGPGQDVIESNRP